MTTNAFFLALDAANLVEVNKFLDDDPNLATTKDEEDRMPLHYAAEVADEETFKKILFRSLSTIDAQDSNGFTPLAVAVQGVAKKWHI